jgi:hypothetical protein
MRHVQWTQAEFDALKTARTYIELREIAEVVLIRFGRPVAQVCGPISTGGLGTVAENTARLDVTIETLINEGEKIFDQIPFEEPISRICSERNRDSYDWMILYEFYQPLFIKGYINKMYFLPGWQRSIGATWEREQAVERGFEIIDIQDI